MNTPKISRSRKPAHILVGSILALLAPSVSASVLYTENFVSGIDGANMTSGTFYPTGWTANNSVVDSVQGTLRGSASTPDGDGWYVSKWTTNSGPMNVNTRAGEYTLLNADRIETQFKVDWAASTNNGMRFIAQVNNKFYATDLFGTTPATRGEMIPGNGIVNRWVTNETINLETASWYQAQLDSSNYAAGTYSTTPLKGLPTGNISIFGVVWITSGNGDQGAADNFRISAAGATEKYVWDGGAMNFDAANWTKGASGQTPAAATPMVIDTASSVANVAADFLTASSVTVGQTAASTLDINNTLTLGATKKVTVGASGTLQVNGTLNTPLVTSGGTVAISTTGTLTATDLQISGGSVTTTGTGTLGVTGQLRLDGGTLTHNSTAAAPSILVFNGGTLAGTGSVVPTLRYEVNTQMTGGVRTISNNLSGATTALTIEGPTGIVELTGTNTYGGRTSVLTRTILRASSPAAIGAGNLYLENFSYFQRGAVNRVTFLETQGSFTRAIGTGAGEVSFSGTTGDGKSAVGFAAYGGPLTINFGGAGGTVDWSSATGLNNVDFHLGSANGNNVVTLVNGLDMKADRNLYVIDNLTSTGDYAIIQGAINNGDATPRLFTKSGAGRLVLTGVNTYTGNTTASQGLLEIGGAGQLGAAGTYAGNLAITGVAPLGFKYNSSATQILSGIVSGSGTLLKSGAGTLTLSGAAANTHTGATTVDGGTLIMAGAVTPTGNSAVAANAAGTVGTLQLDYTTNTAGKINDAAVFSLGGGTIDLKGTHVTTGIEVVGSTTLNAGASRVTQSVAGTVLRMNAITRNVGGVINFAAASIADTDKNNTNLILGPWATVGGTNYAQSVVGADAGAADTAITAYTAYAGLTDIDALSGLITDGSATNVRIGTAAGAAGPITLSAGTTSINTLLQSTAAATTVATAGSTLRTGGIMIASGQESVTIGAAAGDGTLTHNTGSGNNPDLVLINNNAAKTLTINAVIANNGTTNLATAGAGPIVLAAANTFTGTTNANGGELRLANALALQNSTLNTTVNNTIKFEAGVTAATLSGLSGSGGFALQDTTAAAVALSVGNNNATTTFLGALSASAGSLNKIGSGTLTLSGDLAYTGGTTVTLGRLILAGSNAAATGDITVASGASVQFNAPVAISGTGRNVKPANSATTTVISGYAIDNAFLSRLAENGNAFTIALNSASPNNLDLNTSAGANLPNASLAATATATYTGTITPNASAYRFGGGSANLTLNTVLADSGGATSLTKTGTDTVILLQDNTYTGTTTISGGTLQVGNGALSANGVFGSLGSGDVINNGTLTFNRGFNFAYPALTVANNISGSGALNKTGGLGTVILSGTNNYIGATSVTIGALQYNSTAAVAVGGGAAVRDISTTSNGTIVFGPAFGAVNLAPTLLNKIAAGSSGAIAADNYAATNFDFNTAGLTAASLGAVGNVNYTGTLTPQGTTYRLGGGGGTLTMSNVNAITGANALTIAQLEDTVIFPVSNDYTGLTTVTFGALRIGHATALGTTAGGTTVTNGGALELYNNVSVVGETLSLIGNGPTNPFTALNTRGALRNISGDNIWGGPITLAAATRINSDSGTLTLDVASGNAITGTQALTFGGTGNIAVADTINILTQTLTKEGSGRLELTGTNTYTGTTTISNGTIFAISGTGLPATSLLSFNGDGVGAGADYTFTGGVLESNGIFARTIQNVAGGNNVFWTSNRNGGFAAKGGTLDVTLTPFGFAANSVIDWSNTTVGFNATRALVLNSETADNVVTLTNPVNMIGNRTITVLDNPATTADYAHLSGILSGTNLTKFGAGRLLLSAANTYTGTTTISVGTLALGGNAPSGGNGALGNSTGEVVLGGAGYGNDASLIVTGGAFTVGRIIRIPTLDVTDPGTRVLTIGGDTAHSSVFSGSIFLGSSSNAGKGVTLTAAASGQVTFSGLIQNPSSMDATVYTVTKSGAGTVIFSNAGMAASGYTGLTLVADGTLQLGVNNGIRSGNAVTVAPTGANSVLDLAGFNQTIGGAGLTIGGATTSSAASVIGAASTLTLSGGATAVTYNAANNPLGGTISATNITLGAAALPQTFTVGDSSTVTGVGNELTISSTITEFGAGSALVKEGAGSLKLDGAQSYNILTVNDGTANVNGILGTAPGLAVVTVSDTAGGVATKLRFGSVSQTLSSLTIGAGATVIFTSGAASGSLTGDDGGGKAAGFGSPASSFGGGATVPEPGTLGLLLVGALGMLNRRRRA